MGKKAKSSGDDALSTGGRLTSYKVHVISAPGESQDSTSSPSITRPLLLDDSSFTTCEREFSLYRNQQARKSSQLRLAADTERVLYEGVNYGKHSADTLPYRYAVALLDGASGTAQVYADPELFVCNRLIKRQQPTTRPTDEEEEEEEREGETREDAAAKYLKSRMLLGESFGTKRTKQMLSSLDRNKINMEQLATQSAFISRNIDNSISRMAEEEEQQQRAREEGGPDPSAGRTPSTGHPNDSILPPYNGQTRKVAEIYRMQDLIPHDVYYALQVDDLVNALQNKSMTDQLATVMAPYVMEDAVEARFQALASLVKLPERAALTHTVRCLVYLNHLLHFRALSEAKINAPNLASHLPMASAEVLSALPHLFAEAVVSTNGKERFKLSTLARDRLIVHIGILALTLDGFRTNVARLSAALRLPAVKTADYMKAIGCTLEHPGEGEPTRYTPPGSTREVQVKMAVLKAPLTIAPLRVRKGPSRR